MKKVITIALIFIAFFCVFIFFVNKRYLIIEHVAKKEMTDRCLLLAIVDILNQYYKNHGKYPEGAEIGSIIWQKGYPEGLGCGKTNIKGIKEFDILNSFGDRLEYEYMSEKKVKLFFSNKREGHTSYQLVNGQIGKVSGTTSGQLNN